MYYFLVQSKKKMKKDVIEDENHEYEMFIQRTQNDYDRDMYDINNRLVKSISSNKIIKRKENFLFIKFSNERFLNI